MEMLLAHIRGDHITELKTGSVLKKVMEKYIVIKMGCLDELREEREKWQGDTRGNKQINP